MGVSELATFAQGMMAENRGNLPDLPGLTIYGRAEKSEIEAQVYEPVICLILQGSKVTSAGERAVTLRPGDALLVSHDLPVLSRIVEAPYIALILALDPGAVRGLYEQLADAALPERPSGPLAAGAADPGWLEPLERYAGLQGDPLGARILGPGILREIHFRLLMSPLGGTLRSLLRADSHASRVARAIKRIRAGYRAPLAVAELARAAGMSASSFHEHFKAVTGTTPLQYQKDLRLIEARGLLVGRAHSVAQAAFAVGYESPTHFSRDYSRKFGLPPSRDAGGAGAEAG